MKIIFLKDIAKKGRKYEVKEVANGYGRHLVATGVAEFATPENVARIERKRATDATEKKIHTDLLLKNLAGLNGASITLYGKANDAGHLFASIHKAEILEELKRVTKLDMHPDFLILDKPLKEIGNFEIPVVVGDVKTSFTVSVEASK
ncbi:MAG: 50S ribosomal protein L9 [Candidatus Pacebacteria bacterium]|nr:50S ribosomal protein L9 [Candidatus Paceibacterota bacterium]